MPNISEFERTKPTVTMRKLKTSINKVSDRMKHVGSLSEVYFLEDLLESLKETVQSLKKGE
jgi:hypothetical protein